MGKAFKMMTVLLSVVAFTGRAWGADNGYVPPPVEADGNWVNWLMAGVFLVVFCAVTFKNSKRTHLD